MTLEESEKKEIMKIDMAWPNQSNKDEKRQEKVRKYQQLCFHLREREDRYNVKVIHR